MYIVITGTANQLFENTIRIFQTFICGNIKIICWLRLKIRWKHTFNLRKKWNLLNVLCVIENYLNEFIKNYSGIVITIFRLSEKFIGIKRRKFHTFKLLLSKKKTINKFKKYRGNHGHLNEVQKSKFNIKNRIIM